ncbi:MAG: hypothetical protein H0V04_03680 [Chloroflexi bacterium]|nr:hypothetical protein [Chloroflexota bacterium]
MGGTDLPGVLDTSPATSRYRLGAVTDMLIHARRARFLVVFGLSLTLLGCGAQAPPTQAPSGAPGSPSAGPLATGPTPSDGSPAASPTGSDGLAATPSPEPTADHRVEDALAALDTDEELVGQLLLVGWSGTSAEGAQQAIDRLRPGGVVFIANASRAERATAINLGLEGLADAAGIIPLLKAIDHEGGAVQRIEDVTNVGSNLEFASNGATEGNACERGATHARQLREMGFDANLAPVLDVNTNPDNPVIGDRSYGSDPRLVARLGSAYVRGLQAGGILAVGKHFPGHGDTSVDSHLGLPVLDFGRGRLNDVELVPFKRAIAPETRIAAIMTAHIALPRIDPSGLPATLSQPILTGILRDQLGYEGLVISDDTAAMAAITDGFEPGEAAIMAIGAGVDMLIIGGDLDRQVLMRDALIQALGSGALSRDRVVEAARHVLSAKARFGVLGDQLDPEPGCEG